MCPLYILHRVAAWVAAHLNQVYEGTAINSIFFIKFEGIDIYEAINLIVSTQYFFIKSI